MAPCLWCGQSFTPRTGGKAQRFCCPGHRRVFHTAARRWAETAVAVGLLNIVDLRGHADTSRDEKATQSNVHVAEDRP